MAGEIPQYRRDNTPMTDAAIRELIAAAKTCLDTGQTPPDTVPLNVDGAILTELVDRDITAGDLETELKERIFGRASAA